MINILWDLTQGSDEWHQLRNTKISATDAYDLINGVSISDILEKKSANPFLGNDSTRRGHILEREARKIYESLNDTIVREAGAILNDKFPLAMCSPDGILENENGLIEIKGFEIAHHEDVIKNLDPHLIAQINFQLLISERDFVDFIAYCPEEQDINDAFIVNRIYPDLEIQSKLKKALITTYDDSCIQEISLTLIKLEQQLQAQNEVLKAQLVIREALNNEIAEIKQRLKDSTSGKVSKTVNLGDDKLEVSIYDAVKIEAYDPSEVPIEYTSKEEIPRAFVENGKIYQRIPNTKLVQNMVKAGKSLPQGFTQKTSRNIRLKFNGRSI